MHALDSDDFKYGRTRYTDETFRVEVGDNLAFPAIFRRQFDFLNHLFSRLYGTAEKKSKQNVRSFLL